MKILFILFFMLLTINPSFGQGNKFFANTKNISLSYSDTPIRSALEQLLKMGSLKNYLIANDVEGMVTLNLSDQSFENALKIIMRANSVPLLYKIENDVLIIEKRKISIMLEKPVDIKLGNTENNDVFHVVKLNHIDPLDLQVIFGRILNMSQFTRYQNNNMNNFGNMGNPNRQ